MLIRQYHPDTDCSAVERLERLCDVGPSGKMSLFTDLMGDPLCRIRHSPSYLMLVAELPEDGEIIGVIRGCVKIVTCGKRATGKNTSDDDKNTLLPLQTKVAYILGLRVSPMYRRMGIAVKLITRMEAWFRDVGAEYSYMATENDNEASVKLFTKRCAYSKFRTPTILVQPVYAHSMKVSKKVKVFKLSQRDAMDMYKLRHSTTEFFPDDISSIVDNKLNLGTFVAVFSDSMQVFPGAAEFLADPPESWAVLSVWNSNEMFKLEFRGASLLRRLLVKTTRLMDRALPWFRLPSVPDVFHPFGFHFLYGLGGDGPCSGALLRALCQFAHNQAKGRGCGLVVTEVASCEPLRSAIPHWRRLSCTDLWCIKRLTEKPRVYDWTKVPPEPSIFVDPREV